MREVVASKNSLAAKMQAPPSRVRALLTDLRDHQEYLRGVCDLLSAWCYFPEAVSPRHVEFQAICEVKQQLQTLYSARIAKFLEYVIRTHNRAAVEFLLANSFDPPPEIILFPSSSTVALAPFDHANKSPEELMHTASFWLNVPLICDRIRRSTADIKQAIVKQLCTYLPETPAAATLLTAVLDLVGNGHHSFFTYPINSSTLVWKEHLADALFNHPIMQTYELLNTPYLENIKSAFRGYERFVEGLDNTILLWTAVDERLTAALGRNCNRS